MNTSLDVVMFTTDPIRHQRIKYITEKSKTLMSKKKNMALSSLPTHFLFFFSSRESIDKNTDITHTHTVTAMSENPCSDVAYKNRCFHTALHKKNNHGGSHEMTECTAVLSVVVVWSYNTKRNSLAQGRLRLLQ